MIASGLSMAIPDSVLMEDRDLRDKTLKIGQLARAAAIFCVNKIVVFSDPLGAGGTDNILIRDLLEYLETPQYLRRRLYPIRPHLRYAGLLPPLKIPSHKKDANLKNGEFREAVVEEGRMVFVGAPAPIRYEGRGRTGSRQTVRIVVEDGTPLARDAARREVGEYWGYSVQLSNNIFEVCSKHDLTIGTSRLGTPLHEVWEKLANTLSNSNSCIVTFGSPKRGLFDMFRREELGKYFNYMINTIPEQGVETVRTEEAVMCSLEALRLATLLKR